MRRAEGSGFYTWDTERSARAVRRVDGDVGGHADARARFPCPKAATTSSRATAGDADGRRTRTDTSFYGIGKGYTAWQRYDHNRITLEPEKKTWKPGETARGHDPVAVGNGDGAAHGRARRHPPARALRADLDATDRRGADHRSRHPERLRVGAAHPRPHVDRSRARTAATRASRRSGSATPNSPSKTRPKQLGVKVAADRAEYRPANTARGLGRGHGRGGPAGRRVK